ncbi:MAG: hypothetical protein AB1645_04450 [Bacillota bacterium]
MTLLDRLLLAAAGVVALYMVIHFLGTRRKTAGEAAPAFPLYYATSFAVILVAGLLLIAFGYGSLANPLVVIAAALIPLALSLGLVGELHPDREKAYLLFAAVGLAAIAVTRFVGPAGLATVVLAAVHSVAGLVIFFLPLAAWRGGRRPAVFALVTVGGTLIGIGGIALAFLKVGAPILPAAVIFAILAPVLFLMTASFAWGLLRGGQAAGLPVTTEEGKARAPGAGLPPA